MEIKSFPNGIYGATTYLVIDNDEAILIDCTCNIDEIKEILDKEKISLKYILITHGHFDHVYCLKEAKEKFPFVQILIHKEDMNLLENMQMQCSMAGLEDIKLPCVDGLINEETRNLKVGEYDIKIIHTKGHSKGGVCYLIGENLFSGDTLFRESIGRCDLWGGSYSEIEQSIKEKLFVLDDKIEVYPGHGDKTSIEHEKEYNPYFGKQ